MVLTAGESLWDTTADVGVTGSSIPVMNNRTYTLYIQEDLNALMPPNFISQFVIDSGLLDNDINGYITPTITTYYNISLTTQLNYEENAGFGSFALAEIFMYDVTNGNVVQNNKYVLSNIFNTFIGEINRFTLTLNATLLLTAATNYQFKVFIRTDTIAALSNISFTNGYLSINELI